MYQHRIGRACVSSVTHCSGSHTSTVADYDYRDTHGLGGHHVQIIYEACVPTDGKSGMAQHMRMS
jgi:hypothetical protein